MVALRQSEERAWVEQEIAKCALSEAYFINHYCKIYDAQIGDWIPFRLWPAQIEALHIIETYQLTIALKARQIGLTWLALGCILWRMLFRPMASILMFSRRDDEAIYLLGDERLKGMYKQLPAWMQTRGAAVDNAHILSLSNGSVARAFPTNAGDSYTSNLVLIDEADLVPDLNRLMRSVKPTIDAGGKLILISRVDKSKPNSEFKAIYKNAKEGRNGWGCIFLPWWSRPDRDSAWYERQKTDVLARTGTLDDVYEQYPATDAEALASKTLNKRFLPQWLLNAYEEQHALTELPKEAPAIPGLKVYKLPQAGQRYCGGVDPAEGNPTSDDSAAVFLDAKTGEQVAELSGKFQPSTIAAHAATVAAWYNNARLMVERNNHGHAVLLWLRDNRPGIQRAWGRDNKEGWLSNTMGKTILYDKGADALRDGDTIIHSFKAYTQMSSIEGSTLRAPDGDMDDVSDAYMLALQLVGKLGVFAG